MRIRRWVLWAALLCSPIVLFAGIGRIERNAEARAHAFCDRFPIGSSLADVSAAARDAGDPRHRSLGPNEIWVAYIGLPPFSRHICVIKGESGKVTGARYVYLD